jgi:predicted N-acetyltransferase YhbS
MEAVEYLTAETERGRQAILEVMRHSYADDIDHVPPQWTLVRVVDGTPVSWIQVDPARRMEMPDGDLRYAFIMNVATREDRRREGHFDAIMAYTLSRLREAVVPVVVTHGRHALYRRFGFEVFTHHCGIFATPQSITRRLGSQVPTGARKLLILEEHRSLKQGLLLVSEVRARTLEQCRAALLVAAAIAREQHKTQVLFEHPPAPSYGSSYPLYDSPETPFASLARACGAKVCIQGADPEGGAVPDADWIKVLDAAEFVSEALQPLIGLSVELPEAAVSFDTDAGAVTVRHHDGDITVSPVVKRGAHLVRWPSGALAQLVTGYQSADVLAAVQGTPLSPDALQLLSILFPQHWRFSRNESWVFTI